jgi:hypothetical protein
VDGIEFNFYLNGKENQFPRGISPDRTEDPPLPGRKQEIDGESSYTRSERKKKKKETGVGDNNV